MNVICEKQKHDKKYKSQVILEVHKLFPYSLGYYILEMYDPGPRCLITVWATWREERVKKEYQQDATI